MPTATDLWDTVTRAHKPLPTVRYSFRVEGWKGALWHVRRVELVEALSEPYRLTVELVVDEPRLDLDELLGDVCALELDRKTSTRTVHGVILSAADLGRAAGRHHVRLEVGPALALLAQRVDTRAWQDRSAPDILRDVLAGPLGELGRSVKLDALKGGDYPRREYCVQFRESDLGFAQRLMEEEGIAYYFDHSGEAERLVLIDDNHDFTALQGDNPVTIQETEPDTAAAESVQRFAFGRRLRSSAVAQRNFDWQAPQAPRASARTGTDHRGRTREVYEHDDVVYPGDGERLAKIKKQRLAVGAHAASGESNVTGLFPGAWFALQGHARADLDDKYLVTRVIHRGEAPDVAVMLTQASAGSPYTNEFEVIPLKVPFRPAKNAMKPKVSGLQTATVTGPPGEEVHCDEHGRIKILPHWDRMSPQDETSSWWVRCAQALAGSGWGFFALPRIGMEVVVDFLDGDPDRPLVVGCVYNGQNQPPYPLPAEKTKTTIKSNSSPGGRGSNELRFEDQAGAEEVYLHAQQTFNAVVGADMSLSVGASESDSIAANRTTTVGANDTTTVGANSTLTVGANITETAGANHTASAAAMQSFSAGASQSMSAGTTQSMSAGSSQSLSAGSSQSLSSGTTQSVSAGSDQSISVGANRTVAVTGDEKITVTGTQSTSVTGAHSLTTSAASTVKIGAALTQKVGADYTLTISGNNTVKAAQYSLTASKITLTGGGSVISMEGGKISISSSGPLDLTGCGPITLQGPDIAIKGGPISIDGADVTVKGGTIKLNQPGMELVNQTPVAAQLRVSSLEVTTSARQGIVTAKATFKVHDDGTTSLDSQQPFPIFEVDEPTPLGLLPADVVPRRDRALEVIVLGAAHGQGRTHMTVELTVGRHRQSLLVIGDRYWTGERRGAEISEPAPIDILPLTWARAHGGSCECWLDEHSIIDLEHPMNKYGRGFDAGKLAHDLGKAFHPPAGYPRLPADHRRWLANLEDPRDPINGWSDDPRPYCWATLPTDVGVHTQQVHDRVKQGAPMTPDEMLEVVYHRAHPDWVIPIPPAEATVTLKGMSPRGVWSFRLPRLQVFADYELGERTGTRELEPHLLLLLPDESRFYLVYRHYFTMEVTTEMQRSFRLRLAEGWTP